jgi:hypothetical protein
MCKITEPHKEEAKARNGLERHIRRRRIGRHEHCFNFALNLATRGIFIFWGGGIYSIMYKQKYPFFPSGYTYWPS